jgi:hypothetical protein
VGVPVPVNEQQQGSRQGGPNGPPFHAAAGSLHPLSTDGLRGASPGLKAVDQLRERYLAIRSTWCPDCARRRWRRDRRSEPSAALRRRSGPGNRTASAPSPSHRRCRRAARPACSGRQSLTGPWCYPPATQPEPTEADSSGRPEHLGLITASSGRLKPTAADSP